jgi:hypothetical protein
LFNIGDSEYNVGFALDVGSTLIKMEEAPEGGWIKENAWKYGFILRYPKDKTAITERIKVLNRKFQDPDWKELFTWKGNFPH